MYNLDYTDAYPPKIGFSGDEMYFLPHGYDGKPCFLKKGNRKEILDEALIYEWLEDKLPVPKVYLKGFDGKYYFSVVEVVAGKMMQEDVSNLSRDDIIVLFGKLIATIHRIDPTGLPVNHNRDYKMAKVKQTVMHHQAKPQYFERELRDVSPLELYSRMLSLSLFEEDLVLCHGDVCFPNFLLKNHQLVSVLDVGGMGLNDRHLDLAIGLRTLRYNLGDLTHQEQQLFFDAYGISNIDYKKIEFYIYLDELTNG